jgi:inhibitor of cysteine peptidase
VPHRRAPGFGRLLAFLLACACPWPPAFPQAAAAAGDRVLTLEDHEREVSLAVGDVVILKLDAVPSTGYAWVVVHNDVTILEPLGPPALEPADEPPATGPLGASARQVFRFRARAAGRQKLEMHYKRAWEKKPPLKRFEVELRIR